MRYKDVYYSKVYEDKIRGCVLLPDDEPPPNGEETFYSVYLVDEEGKSVCIGDYNHVMFAQGVVELLAMGIAEKQKRKV